MASSDFYALTDNQLNALLEGELDYSKFFTAKQDEKPRECFSDVGAAWEDLVALLDDEKAGGKTQTKEIPKMASYNDAKMVKKVAKALAQIDDEELKERYDDLELDVDFKTLKKLTKSLTAFYQRAAQNGDAVLLRIT
ncbi:DUF1877 family protein [Thiolinea disciformis]|uniref:DUF1877 family protein n=1 Tax=Thiolinea disciformis TaxID=125614 RepID=UPI00037C00E5|nr:DUF1877 family protein [Thiolinea disciformis]